MLHEGLDNFILGKKTAVQQVVELLLTNEIFVYIWNYRSAVWCIGARIICSVRGGEFYLETEKDDV